MLTYGSVCSGIEAATVAWEPLGWKPAWFAEIEPFTSAVLAHHYPRVPNLGDMTKIAQMVRYRLVAAPDVLVGGTPCQAFSVAGVRGGLSDPRGQLTLAYVDLADAIDEQRPGDECVVYWENVPGVLSSSDNAFGCFLGLLAGEASELTPEPAPAHGKNSTFWKWNKEDEKHTCRWPNVGAVYGPKRAIAWRILDAQYFGVAQRRRRVFVVASARKGFDPAKLLFEFDSVRRDTAPRREAGQETAAGTLRSTNGGSDVDHANAGHLQPVGGVVASNAEGATGLPFLTASNIGKILNNQTPLIYANAISPTLRAGGNVTGGDRPPGTDVDTADSLIAYAFQPRIARNGRGDMGELVNALTAQAGETGKGDAAPCVAYAFNARQDPDSWVNRTGPLDTDGSTQCIAYAIQAGALRTNPNSGPDGVGVQPHIAYTVEARAEVQVVNYGYGVRRLMPVECERLQGFPDDYTLVPVKGKPAADGPRYKALGNSMAVPCMRWLGMRLMITHPALYMQRLAA